MTVPIYVVSLVISLAMGYNADRTNQKAWHIFAATILGAASFIVTAIVTNHGDIACEQVIVGAGPWVNNSSESRRFVRDFRGGGGRGLGQLAKRSVRQLAHLVVGHAARRGHHHAWREVVLGNVIAKIVTGQALDVLLRAEDRSAQ